MNNTQQETLDQMRIRFRKEKELELGYYREEDN